MASRYIDAYELVTGVVDMSTAIISKRAEGAFVVGSDGLALYLDGKAPNLDTRKIFELRHSSSVIVCAVMGNPEITSDKTANEMVVDFPASVKMMAEGAWESSTFIEFVKHICQPINETLRLAAKEGELVSFPGGTDITRILFAGFFKGQSAQIEARFFHVNQQLRDVQISFKPDYHYGSRKIAELIENNDPRFKKYSLISPLLSEIDRAVEYIKNHIDAYGSPAAREIDPLCNGIGGMTQVCVVRPDGIEWKYGPAGGDK